LNLGRAKAACRTKRTTAHALARWINFLRGITPMRSAGKVAAAVVVAAIAWVNATNVDAGPISYTGTAYTENFESLGWAPAGAVISAWRDDDTLPGWYASGVSNLRSSQGGASSLADTSLFVYAINSNDKSLGSQVGLVGSSESVIRFGTQIVNDTGTPLSGFTLWYFGEQWRDGGNNQVEQLTFEYAVNAQSLTSGDYVEVPELTFLSPIYTSSLRTLDGNVDLHRTSLAATIVGLNWAPGESLWLRWTDIDDPGAKANSALAIDDLVFTATAFAEPPVNEGSSGVMTPQASMSISEPSTGWLAGLCIAALAVVSRLPKKRSVATGDVQRGPFRK
jgi:hypothetical protein